MPTPLPPDAVARMQQAFVAALDRQIDKAGAGEAVREPLREHLIACARFGRPLEAGAVAEMAGKPAAEIVANTRSMRDPLPAFSRGVMRFFGRLRSRDARFDDLFGKDDRLYFPLEAEAESATQRQVAAVLAQAGYSIVDYAGGHATDAAGKQRFRIGKLLGKLDPALSEDFQQDSARTGDKLVLCLTRDALDIARMSTGRAWWSCMARDGFNFDYVKHEVRQGTLAAYLVRDSDPHVLQPLARMLLKPFVAEDGTRVLTPSKPYGLDNGRFVRTAQMLADRLNAGKPDGIYTIARGLYADGLPMGRTFIGGVPDAERLLTVAGASWDKKPDGAIHVYGTLDISDFGLTHLPDMSHVTVHGGFLAMRNHLTSLDGLPARIEGPIWVNENQLETLRGAPEVVEGDFVVLGNRLATLEGGPRTVHGVMDVSRNGLRDLVGAPERAEGFSCEQNRLWTLRGAPQALSGNFRCGQNRLTSLAGGPGRVDGDYRCEGNALDSLRGAPAEVGGDFDCRYNPLPDLAGAPRKVGTAMAATGCALETLHGAPESFQVLRSDLGTFTWSEPLPAALTQPRETAAAAVPQPRRQRLS